MTGFRADHAMPRLYERQAMGRQGSVQVRHLNEPVEHLTLDFDFLLGEGQAIERRRQGRDSTSLWRARHGPPSLPPLSPASRRGHCLVVP